MARYEEARIRYQKAVLASLNGASSGDAIRQAIVAFQAASGDLKQLTAAPHPSVLRVQPAPEAPKARPAPEAPKAREERAVLGWAFVLRLLRAG